MIQGRYDESDSETAGDLVQGGQFPSQIFSDKG